MYSSVGALLRPDNMQPAARKSLKKTFELRADLKSL